MVSTILLAARVLLLVLGGGALLGVLAEFAVRSLRPDLDYFYVLEPYERKTHHLEPETMPGLGLVSRFRSTSLGLRGREFARNDDYRVLAVGCSVTISVYVDQAKTWASQLEGSLRERTGLRVWAGCVGRSEVTTRDVVTIMRYFVPQYRGTLDAVVFLVGVNDLALMLSKGPDYDPEYLNKAGLERQFLRAFSRLPNRYSSVPTWRKSALAKLALGVKSRLTDQVYIHEGAYYVMQRAARQGAGRVLSELPDMAIGLDEFERNLNTIADLALEHGLRPIFLTQPSLWREGLSKEEECLLWFGWTSGTTDFYSVEAMARGMALYNERLLRVCRIRGLEYVDLAASIPKETSAFYDDVHLNERGSKLVAEQLAMSLSEGLCKRT